ncbi:8-oxoguanine deaminase [Halioxenophilus sp. WMMB6]|uniref:8-oxoguanine deaminase n=1 Tax=Halioxenophilus sp. WMMB6 TaxID=3073815 RepID=UPI00295E83D0|nr:8-oxoguanine deaminase [Halioxenophilus sp. WMMB6]
MSRLSVHKAIWLKNPQATFTGNDQNAAGGVVVAGSEIVELVAAGQTPETRYGEEVDLSGCVLIPGLINTHHHFYQTLTRCLPTALNKELFPWLKSLYQVWQHITPEMLTTASQLAVLELMLSGATTVGDHHYVFSRQLQQAIDAQVEGLSQLGARIQLTRGSMSLSEKDGGLPPDSVVQSEDEILADCERVIQRYHQKGASARLQVALAPCSPFSVSAQLMRETAALAAQHNVLMHTHLAETEDENQFCLQTYGARPVDYLEQCGWLNERTWLAHGIHFTPAEISRLGKAGVGIAHCPSSNMLLASGICPTLELQAAGCRVGLAVDGSASNDCSNMIQEARQSLLQQRLRYGATRITAETVLSWATQGGADIYRRPELGQIAPGKQADLAIFKLDELRFSGAADAIAALVTCGAHRVDKLMVAGQWLIEHGKHRFIDEHKLMATHHRKAKILWGKAGL